MRAATALPDGAAEHRGLMPGSRGFGVLAAEITRRQPAERQRGKISKRADGQNLAMDS